MWQMITVDDIELQGGTAVMKRNGKRFIARILTPETCRFEKLSAKPKHEAESQNEGFAKLAFRVTEAPDRVTLAVQMWLDDGPEPPPARIEPLDDWKQQ